MSRHDTKEDIFISFKPANGDGYDNKRKRPRTGDLEATSAISRRTPQVLEDARVLCKGHARGVYRDVASQVYDEAFSAIARFLERSRSEASQWGQLRTLLQPATHGQGPPTGGGQPAVEPSTAASLRHGGFNCLIPCAIIHPNMSLGDRLMLTTLLMEGLNRRRSSSSSPPAITVKIRAHIHGTLPKIFAAIQDAIEARRRLTTRALSVPPASSRRSLFVGSTISFQDVLQSYTDLSPPTAPDRPRLRLVFVDVEGLESRLLESLLRLFVETAVELPLQLIFLVSPSCPFSANLGTSATSVLEASTFTLPPSRLCFEKLLYRLFLKRELPLTVTARVLRLLRVSFLESHRSIAAFFEHLDTMLQQHFRKPVAMLCMLPYIQATGPSTIKDSQEMLPDATDRCILTLNKQFDWRNPQKEQAFQEVEVMLKAESLRSIPVGETAVATFRHVQKSIKEQVANRCKLWVASHLISKSLGLLQRGSSFDASPLNIYELMLDHDRPARWSQCENKLKQLISTISLRELELLVLAWYDLLMIILSPRNDKGEAVPDMKSSRSRHDLDERVEGAVPEYVAQGSSALRLWRVKVEGLVKLVKALAKDTGKYEKSMRGGSSSKGDRPATATTTMPAPPSSSSSSHGFQSRRLAMAVQQGTAGSEGGSKEGGEEGEEDAVMEQVQREFTIKDRGVRNAIIEVLLDIVDHCIALGKNLGPGHEAVWYDDTKALQQAFFAQVRSQTVRALSDPHGSLGCDCCTAGEISGTSPEICIAYSLFEDDPRRTVSLGNLLDSFIDLSHGEAEEDNAVRRLRLQHALQALETTGFLKPWGNRGEWTKLIYSYSCVRGDEEDVRAVVAASQQ